MNGSEKRCGKLCDQPFCSRRLRDVGVTSQNTIVNCNFDKPFVISWLKHRGTVGLQHVVLEAYLADKLNSHSSHMYGRGLYRVLVGKPQRKGPLERPRRRWEDNVKTYLLEIERNGMEWIDLAQYTDKWLTFGKTLMIFMLQ